MAITDRLRKGRKIHFKDRTETIVQGSTNRLTGKVITNKNSYSTDFICRWLDFGFITITK